MDEMEGKGRKLGWDFAMVDERIDAMRWAPFAGIELGVAAVTTMLLLWERDATPSGQRTINTRYIHISEEYITLAAPLQFEIHVVRSFI